MASTRRKRTRYDPDASSGTSFDTSRDRRSPVEREFDNDYRDPRFPPGWFVLPLVGVGVLIGVLAMLTF